MNRDDAEIQIRRSVCIVSCSSEPRPNESTKALAAAFHSIAAVSTIILCDSEKLGENDHIIKVSKGTKLSKIKHLSDRVNSDLICICDPDIKINKENALEVLKSALDSLNLNDIVVAFGVIEGRDAGSTLSKVICIDKWISHRVLRRTLWSIGAAITIPGQFVIVSTTLLAALDPSVDSYLDDLYLGWLARSKGAIVSRVPLVVGHEDPRLSWGSLVTQRIRWMKGLVQLLGHFAVNPAAIYLLAVHFFAYHCLPIVFLVSLLCLFHYLPLVAIPLFGVAVITVAVFSNQNLRAASIFLTVFPLLHCIAIITWWFPANRESLIRR